MANFEIPENPKYQPDIRKFETTDKAHADLFNKVIESLVNNDTFIKLFVEALAEKVAEHENDTISHITQKERDGWDNTKEDIKSYAKSLKANGKQVELMDGNGKALSTITTQDTVYTHPANHPPSIITQDSNNRFMTDAEKTKLAGIATGANAYSHPAGNGYNHIPAGGASGQILQCSSAGTATWSNALNNYLPLAGGTVSGTILSTAINALQLHTTDSRIVDVYGNITLRTHITEGQPNIEIGQRNSNIGNVRIYSSRDPNKGFSVWDVSEDRGIFYAQENASYQPIIKAPPVYDTTTGNAPNMYVSPQGIFYRSTSSSRRYKNNVRKIDTESYLQTRTYNHFINDSSYLKRVLDIETYIYDYSDRYIAQYYNNYNPAKNKLGFIVEQIQDVFPEAVEYEESYDEENDMHTINYDKPEMWNIKVIVPALHFCVKEHEQKIKEQEFLIAEMSSKIEKQQKDIEYLKEQIKILKGNKNAN